MDLYYKSSYLVRFYQVLTAAVLFVFASNKNLTRLCGYADSSDSSLVVCVIYEYQHVMYRSVWCLSVLLNLLVTLKAAPRECVNNTGLL